jgi:predicted ATP-grasp superfamily ATP-dependent carboligase
MKYAENVLVIGGSHHNTLGVVRALGEKGFDVDLITIGSSKERYVSSSRYVTSHHALANVKELSSYLLYRKQTNDDTKEVVISCADIVTEHLNQFKESLEGRYILPGSEQQGKMLHLSQKTTMIDMAAKRGIQAPKVWKLSEDKNIIKFPCITKSYISSHGGKADVKVFCKQRELDSFLDGCKDDIFVQPYIEKKEEVQFIGCSLRGGEEVIIPGMTHILRSQPNTNTGFLEYGPIDPFYTESVERSKLYIKDCGYSGLFSIEFIRSKEDDIYFLEINFRNDGNAWCVTAAGVNLPVIWVKANMGIDYEDEIHEVKSIIVMPEFQDFKLVLQHKVKLFQWIKDVRRTDAFLDWNKKDKKPFFRFILNKI